MKSMLDKNVRNRPIWISETKHVQAEQHFYGTHQK
jgi:hypothetical protein